jgi:ketosteroid isomerase-like protein
MNNSRLFRSLLVIVATLVVVSSASAQMKEAASKPAADAEFKALIDGYYAAWSSMNTDNAAKYYATKDADMVVYDIAPLKYKGWAEYAKGVKENFFDGAVSAKLTPNDDLAVTRRGNIAWTTVTFHLSGKLKSGDSMELDARHTAIWEKRDAKWLIVHEHISAPLPQ